MIKTVCPIITHLGEAPIYNKADGCLCFADIHGGKVYRHNCESRETSLYYSGGLHPGGLCFDESGTLLMFTQRGIFAYDGRNPVPVKEIPLRPHENFNDVIADPRGRVFAGTVDRVLGGTGTLWRFERGKEPYAVMDGIGCSNGMGFSPDLTVFYHTDSRAREIRAYDYDPDTGAVSYRGVVYRSAPGQGVPDGMTVDSEGFIWSAFWGGGCVRRISPEGDCTETAEVPARQPSSVAFGGELLNRLYITSACEGGDDLEKGTKNGVFLGGPLYMTGTGVSGRAEFESRLV